MSNITPGPWTINEWTQPARSISVGAVGTPLICRVMLRDVSINELKANAALIAAAPDLLASLVLLDKAYDESEEFPTAGMTKKVLSERWKAARAAIAKATA